MIKESWRDIPRFPKYEISTHGVVRLKETKIEAESLEVGESYCYVILDEGLERVRAIRPLMNMVFPEIMSGSANQIDDPIEIPKVEWRDIPGFPDFQISEKAQIRIKSNPEVFLTTFQGPDEGDVRAWVSLWADGRPRDETVTYLFALAFPEKVKTEEEWNAAVEEKLRELVGREVKRINAADNYGLNDQITQAVVNELIKEGWRPENEFD